MSRRRFIGLAAVLALPLLSSAYSLDAERPRPSALKNAYHIHLQSAWPQLAGGAPGCVNGGEEALDGTLTLGPSGLYTGTFNRHTRLLFCGVHGAAAGDACELVLQGEGTVAATADVVADGTSPSRRSARLQWVPSQGNTATVTGACPAAFKEAVEEMYLSVRHGVELPLTVAGSGLRSERLEDYAWIVSVD